MTIKANPSEFARKRVLPAGDRASIGTVVHVTSTLSVLPLPEPTNVCAAAKDALRTYNKARLRYGKEETIDKLCVSAIALQHVAAVLPEQCEQSQNGQKRRVSALA